MEKERNQIIVTTKTQKKSRGMPILAICSLTRRLQSIGKRVFHNGTDTKVMTHGHRNFETESAQRADSVKIFETPSHKNPKSYMAYQKKCPFLSQTD